MASPHSILAKTVLPVNTKPTITTITKTDNAKVTKASVDIDKNTTESCVEWNGKLDTDGIKICPDTPLTTIAKCAFDQANTWVPPREQQSAQMAKLVQALKDKNAVQIKRLAKELGLRVCRVKKVDDATKKILDSYLVLVTRANINDYSGPFIYWREINATPFIISALHNGIDKTEQLVNTFKNTNIQALYANGQKKNLSKEIEPCSKRPTSDCTHNTYNLAWATHKALTADPRIKEIHVHGKSKPGVIVTNGFKRKVDPNSFMYHFTNAIYQHFGKNNEKIQSTLFSCANGTPLHLRPECNIMQSWVQVRDLVGSIDPNCKFGKEDKDRVVGLEMYSRWLEDQRNMTSIVKNLENIYGTLDNPKILLVKTTATSAVTSKAAPTN